MAGVNKVILLGNVGRDAEVRYTQSGTAVANCSLATSEAFGKGDDRKEETTWHNLVFWGKQAETAGTWIKKGKQLYVEGRIQTRDWTDPQGVKHYKTEIVVQSFQFIGKREESTRDDSGYEQDEPHYSDQIGADDRPPSLTPGD